MRIKYIVSAMIKILRTDSTNTDFIALVNLLDQDLQVRDGAEHSFFKQYNKIDKIQHVVLAYADGNAVGCGAFKKFNDSTIEVKRMFVRPEMRGKGIAIEVLKELEKWAFELGYVCSILETGYRQPEAIRLYQKNDYKVIPNYGQYVGVASSVCMTKALK